MALCVLRQELVFAEELRSMAAACPEQFHLCLSASQVKPAAGGDVGYGRIDTETITRAIEWLGEIPG
jgi:hypothetical protein|eukprot:SAG25_NODE_3091_length_1222_cov_478.019590_1_plen_67_part_00